MQDILSLNERLLQAVYRENRMRRAENCPSGPAYLCFECIRTQKKLIFMRRFNCLFIALSANTSYKHT